MKKRRICYLVAGLIMLLICLTSVSSKAESEMSAVEYRDLISSKGISSRDEYVSKLLTVAQQKECLFYFSAM